MLVLFTMPLSVLIPRNLLIICSLVLLLLGIWITSEFLVLLLMFLIKGFRMVIAWLNGNLAVG